MSWSPTKLWCSVPAKAQLIFTYVAVSVKLKLEAIPRFVAVDSFVNRLNKVVLPESNVNLY
jgi:hypothetical protein